MKTARRLAKHPVIFLIALFWAHFVAPSCFAQDEIIDSVMYADPKLPIAKLERVFPKRLLTLWLQALERPENEIKCQAAAAIGLAKRRGMPGLESTIEPLVRTLDLPDQNINVRLAVVQALITLDARHTAPRLFVHSQADGIDMRNLVEPCLARWDYAPIRAVWLERLNQPKPAGRGWLLAIEGLGTVKETKAAAKLRELALAPTVDSMSRLAAARALADLVTKSLEPDAESLAGGKVESGVLPQLVAATILRKHRGETAAKIQQRLALEAEPAAAVIALEGLLSDDPSRILPLLPRVLASSDAAVRARGIEAFRRIPRVDQIPAISKLMDDPNTLVRTSARKALVEVATKSEFGDLIREQAMGLLGGTSWRALEQAALLLATLDHKAAAPRLVELLQFNRPEVFVAAAWGLRKLAVPATFPGQLHEIEVRLKGSQRPGADYPHAMIDRELVQLSQSLGLARYGPAGPILERFIRKSTATGAESRSAAIWALGYIHEKTAPPNLVEKLIERLMDDGLDAEDPTVRGMSAIALGRMKAADASDVLRRYYSGELTLALFPSQCGWAQEQITGEKMAISGTVKSLQVGWFLEPIE